MSGRIIEPEFDTLLDENGIREFTHGKAADAYVHITRGVSVFRTCHYAVVEYKGSHLKKALDQLEESIIALKRNGKRVDMGIVKLRKGLNKFEKRIFLIENHRLYIRRGRSTKRPVIIDNVPVFVITG